MSRTVSDTFRKAMFDQETGEVIVLLLTITHPDLPETIRISSDNQDLLDEELQLRGTVSRENDFNFLPMSASLPEEGDDAANTIQITVDNVSQDLTEPLKSTVTPATVTAEIVLASAPDDVEVTYPDFELNSAEVDAGSVKLSLSVDVMSGDPYPADNFTPSAFGGLWATT